MRWPAITSAISPGPLEDGCAKKRAMRIAPRAFSRPAPCVSRSYPPRTCAVYWRIAFTAFGVSRGLASSISATVPDTTGAATLVPLRLMYGLYQSEGLFPAIRLAGLVCASVLNGSVVDSMPTPGAIRSGLAAKSIHDGPRALKMPIVSSERAAVPAWLAAPTVSTHGALPGDVMPPYCAAPLVWRPRLPAAATTTMAASTARLAGCADRSGSEDL